LTFIYLKNLKTYSIKHIDTLFFNIRKAKPKTKFNNILKKA